MLRGGSDLAKRDLPPELSAALRLAWALAARLGHACVGTEHLLLALAMQPPGADGRLLHWAGLTGPEIAAAVLRLHGRGAPSDVLPQGLTQAARRAVSRALNGPERLLTALLRESGCSAVRLLEHCGICPQQLFTQLCEGELARKERSMQNTRLLDQFGVDMLERAGKREPVIGRRQEIETVLQILSRRHKNNPALIGEPGVGKTAIVEGVAQYLAAGTVPEPLRWLEPSEQETRTLHALEEYGIMNVKLYEDIVRHGTIATGFDYPVRVAGRYIMSPSPIPRFDNPKMHQCPALQLFGAGREKRLYAIPPYTDVESLDFEDYPFTVQSWDEACAICGSTDTYLDEVILDDQGNRMFVCSDTDCCARRAAVRDGQGGAQ